MPGKRTENCSIANLWYQGVVFSPVSFNGDLLSKPEQAYEELPEEESISRGVMAKLKEILDPFKLIFHWEVVNSLSMIEGCGICWHPHKHILAFISGNNQVTIHDYDDPGKHEIAFLTDI